MDFVSIELLHELIVAVVQGLFLVASTSIPMWFIYRIYLRHLSKKQTEQTCYFALLELKRRDAIEQIYCAEIDANNVDGVKTRIRMKASKDGHKADTDRFAPHRLHRKIETYKRRVEDGLPVVV